MKLIILIISLSASFAGKVNVSHFNEYHIFSDALSRLEKQKGFGSIPSDSKDATGNNFGNHVGDLCNERFKDTLLYKIEVSTLT